MTTFTATYSPEDNKLRLYASSRLDAELYARVKAAGFVWAPKQELFVAPMWTPAREDLCLELAGELDDEDRSLVDRAKERADRFDGYRDNRLADAQAANDSVKAIADNIPLGQPILIGHHSERHARRDQARIESGMRRAVKMWDTAAYWKARAAGASLHADYKDRPKVRARRIRTLEADLRRCQRNKAETERKLQAWTSRPLTIEEARGLSNSANPYVAKTEGSRWTAWDVLRPDEERFSQCPAMTVEQVQEKVRSAYGGYLPHLQRWIGHYENRIAYERALLNDQGASSLLDKKPRPKLAPADDLAAPARPQFEAMRQQLKTGIQVVAVPQLFVTSAELARRMVECAEIERAHRVLEPSAGTGALMAAIGDGRQLAGAEAVELNNALAGTLRLRFPWWIVHDCDFLACTETNLGRFDRILMNPPFENGSDIKHIEQARSLLGPGGRIVAICANGPRQQRCLKPLCESTGGYWEDLPAGSFKHAGTMVNTALIIING